MFAVHFWRFGQNTFERFPAWFFGLLSSLGLWKTGCPATGRAAGQVVWYIMPPNWKKSQEGQKGQNLPPNNTAESRQKKLLKRITYIPIHSTHYKPEYELLHYLTLALKHWRGRGGWRRKTSKPKPRQRTQNARIGTRMTFRFFRFGNPELKLYLIVTGLGGRSNQ